MDECKSKYWKMLGRATLMDGFLLNSDVRIMVDEDNYDLYLYNYHSGKVIAQIKNEDVDTLDVLDFFLEMEVKRYE